MTHDESKSHCSLELEEIQHRLKSIDESIKVLLVSVQSLSVCSGHSAPSASQPTGTSIFAT
jgi:hypothetical protein